MASALIKHQSDDTFAEYKTSEGEYIDTWYEYLPEEVLNGTAEEGSIPLILANHGGGDDARVFVEEFGLLELAGQERIAVVAPDHQLIAEVRGPALAAVVKYMLETYPALDASRVYATGYSMGGGASYTVGYYEPRCLPLLPRLLEVRLPSPKIRLPTSTTVSCLSSSLFLLLTVFGALLDLRVI